MKYLASSGEFDSKFSLVETFSSYDPSPSFYEWRKYTKDILEAAVIP